MKKLIINFLGFIYTIRLRWNGNLYNFRRNVRRAAKAKKRSYVYFIGGKYRVFTRKDIQALKNKGVLNRKMNIKSMSGICLFDSMTVKLSHPNAKYNRFKI